MKTKYIIFDLDDTLMYEIDYLKSAYKEIAFTVCKKNANVLFDDMFSRYKKGKNVFEYLTCKYPDYSKNEFLDIYRNHIPNIVLNDDIREILLKIKSVGYKLGLITDGRAVTQRNKLKTLGIDNLFDKIVISEEFGSSKPDERNFRVFLCDEIDHYFYVADNTEKDFIAPNRLGWTSICLLDNGNNIHSQNFDVDEEYLPKIKVINLKEINDIIFDIN
jgi:putative hydrolase of the HAD superfamily